MDERRALEVLTRRLWDERRVVTYLLFKLTVTRLLLAADERRFVPDALEEVERTVGLLRQGEQRREEALRALAGVWRVAPDQLTLQRLARDAPTPYDHTFGEHLAAFGELAAQIESVARENRILARAELEHVGGLLEQLTGVEEQPTTYDASGQIDASSSVGGHVRKVL